MSAALVKSKVFADEIGFGETRFYVAEFIDLPAVNIAELAMIVHARFGMFQRALDRSNGGEKLVFDLDQVQSFGRDVLVHRGDSSYWLAHHSNFFDRQRVFVFADGHG